MASFPLEGTSLDFFFASLIKSAKVVKPLLVHIRQARLSSDHPFGYQNLQLVFLGGPLGTSRVTGIYPKKKARGNIPGNSPRPDVSGNLFRGEGEIEMKNSS